MLAVVCPGQGSQTPGLLSPWLELPGVEALLDSFSDAAGVDLKAHGTTSDAETIKDTAVAQPLIVAASLVALRVLLDGAAATDVVDVTGGHSVGELAAAAVAGSLTDIGAVSLVGHRARAMAKAAAAAESGMAAVVGGDPVEVLAAIEAAGLTPANVNGGGQVVAAGSPEGLAALAANPPAKARVIPLQVAGAFHTSYMSGARDEFAAAAQGWDVSAPALPLLSNADGAVLGADTDGTEVLRRLVDQVASPVRWDLCQESLAARGVTGIVELLPGGVLCGLARRALPGVPSVAIKSPDDLDKARQLAATTSVATTSSASGSTTTEQGAAE